MKPQIYFPPLLIGADLTVAYTPRKPMMLKLADITAMGNVQTRFNLSVDTMQYLRAYKYGDSLMSKLASK